MSAIPSHLLAVLSGAVRARPVASVVPMRDKTPVFEQSGKPHAVRSLVSIIEECEIESHDAPQCIEGDSESFALHVEV